MEAGVHASRRPPFRAKKAIRALTLIELLVAMTLSTIVAAGAVTAFDSAITFQNHVVPEREVQLDRQRFEDQVTRLIESAYISDDLASNTYMIGGSSSGNSGTGLSQGATSDTLIFTILGVPPNSTFMNSQDDFETRNDKFGPQGGAAEMQLSTTPVGEAGDRKGLFLRQQRPSDGDAYQGGYESVLDSRVTSISFEFWNGETWQGEWDTVNQGARRLPAAVRVTYSFEGEENSPHIFIVRIPLSDVTPDNPLGVGG